MKKNIVLLLLAITCQVFAQTYPITGINISLPSNPDANTAEWAKAMPPLMISAQTRMEYGKVSPMVMESRILVSIKGGGTVCGSYTKANAPASNFNSPAKVWSGETALNLLGKACVLKPGNYEFCVQFYGEGAVGQVLIGEACKSFTIKETEQLTYQPPQPLAPANGTELSESDLKKPRTFHWTPVIPKPQEPVTYRLKVWQLLQGQTGTQAIQVNQPIITKDVDNITQALVIWNPTDGETLALSEFVWNVQALDREGKPIGSNNGTSEVFTFMANSCDVNLALELRSIECLPPSHGFNNYKVCIASTYSSPNYNLTYSGSNGLKAYPPTYTPFYAVSSITPVLQVQNSGATTTVNYCFNVSVPTGQTSIKVGLQGDDKDPGPMICQPGAELDLRLPDCIPPTCDCGTWSPLSVQNPTGTKRYDCGSTIEWTCKQALNFTANYQCSPNDKTCEAKTTWKLEKNGVLVKSGTGTNQLNDGFSLLENGTYNLTLNASCNGKICPPCTFTIVIKDCIPTCDCGTWSPLLINGVKFKCGNEKPINLSCNKPVAFSNSYQCSPNDKTCQAETKWEVTKDGSSFSSGNGSSGTFTPTSNGTYTLTTYANCNGKECKPCVTTFIVEDCKPADPCRDVLLCNTDFEQFVNISGPSTYVQTSQNNIACWKTTASDSKIEIWKSGFGTVPAFSGNYFAELNATQVGTLYQTFTATGPITVSVSFAHRGRYAGNDKMQVLIVSPGGISTLLGNYSANNTGWLTNVTLPYTIPSTALGIYTLQFKSVSSNNGAGPTNGGNFLDSITVTCAEVTSDDLCICGIWSPLTVLDAAHGKKYDCGSTIEWTCKQALNFSASYQCSPNDKTCEATTTWKVEKAGVIVKSGTGTNQLNDGFSLLENGTYNLTLNASCNGKICPPCTYVIVVKDCNPPICDCGTWSPLLINRVKYECGNERPINLSCNKPVAFSNTYQCSPNDKTCQAETKWEVTKDGDSFSSGNGSSGTFTPTANGTYTLTTYANCNGKECEPCITTFVVRDCDEKPCDIGDNCQGGIVFYILQFGDPGYVSGETHGLIAAPSDQSLGAQWGCLGTIISGADGMAIGTGNQNTLDIVNGCATSGIAARLCNDLVLGGYSDWYLPSKDELNKLYLNKTAVGGFANDNYWSSTEYLDNNNNAWAQSFYFGHALYYYKTNTFRVRAIRSF